MVRHGHSEKSDWLFSYLSPTLWSRQKEFDFKTCCGLPSEALNSVDIFICNDPVGNICVWKFVCLWNSSSCPFHWYLCFSVHSDVKRLAEKEDWVVDNEGITSLVRVSYVGHCGQSVRYTLKDTHQYLLHVELSFLFCSRQGSDCSPSSGQIQDVNIIFVTFVCILCKVNHSCWQLKMHSN